MLLGVFALLIPSANNDYSLSALPIIVMPALGLIYENYNKSASFKWLLPMLVLILLYTLTLFSFTTSWIRFPLSANKAPVLFLILVLSFLLILLTELYSGKSRQ